MEDKEQRTWVEISTKALKHNFGLFKKMVKSRTSSGSPTLIATVVKSNAYGHGLVECGKLFAKWGTDMLCVDDIDEAIALREAKVKIPILVLGYVLDSRIKNAGEKNISITIGSLDQLKNCLKIRNLPVRQAGCKLRVHLKVETGLNRRGMGLDDFREALGLIAESNNVGLEGVYSHFAAAELARPEHREYTEFQIENLKKYREIAASAVSAGQPPTRLAQPLLWHMSGSAATMLLNEAWFDMIRPGIAMYGLWPSESIKKNILQHTGFQARFDLVALEPALSWKSVVAEVKELEKGEGVGYDLTEHVKRASKIAVIPVGYWHGYPRALSGLAHVLIGGKKCKLLGRVAMDMIVADVTEVKNVKREDEVVLIGRQGKEEITADELANLASTINYELVTRINQGVIRKFL